MSRWGIAIFRHFFFPHHSNNYKAKTIQSVAFIIYIVFLLLVQTGWDFVKGSNSNILGYATNITVEEIVHEVNNRREKERLPLLAVSQDLVIAASEKGSDMFKYDYWAHVSPTGVTPWDFITHAGYKYTYAGENLAKNFDSSKEVVDAWMNSPSHRANILKPEYTEIGIAVLNGKLKGEETTLVVQEFGAKERTLADVKIAQEEKLEEQVNANSQLAIPMVQEKESENIEGRKPIMPLQISRTMSLFIAQFLLVILLIDSIFIWKHKTIRVSGHSLAHILFVIMLLGAMGATGVGAIL